MKIDPLKIVRQDGRELEYPVESTRIQLRSRFSDSLKIYYAAPGVKTVNIDEKERGTLEKVVVPWGVKILFSELFYVKKMYIPPTIKKLVCMNYTNIANLDEFNEQHLYDDTLIELIDNNVGNNKLLHLYREEDYKYHE